jgi:fused signal recognition particle receptor
MDELEMRLITADAGIEATDEIMQELRKNCRDETQLFEQLQQILTDKLLPHERPLDIDKLSGPFVILVIGVNGAGKTTTIGKLANRYQQSGHKVMLAAGDTFRAAAVEQLQAWGDRHNVPVIAQSTGADSASVLYDALEAAKARGIDVLIADTAGRLHTKSNLMDELVKIKRVLAKLDNNAPHETLLILDAGTGQNAVSQTSQFHQAIGITGLALTKLDGTAKGGVLFALARQFDLPVRFIGIGEQADDLRDFSASEFVSALLGTNPVSS